MKRARENFLCSIVIILFCAGCAAVETPRAQNTIAPTPTLAQKNTRGAVIAFTATVTPRATQTFTKTFTPTQRATRTSTLTRTFTPTRRPTRRPQPTATVTPIPPLLPAFTPAFPEGWFHTVNFVPASVAPGQPYWRLVSATFCDVPPPGQKEKTCPDYPGEILDTIIYVAVLDENGACVENPPLFHEINTGERFPLTPHTQTYPWTSCATDYEWSMFGESNDFWLDGLPSDRIGGLLLNSPQLNWAEPRAHVRYFLIFQRATR